MAEIAVINIGALFGDDLYAIGETDRQIARAAFDVGFMVVTGYPADLQVGPEARQVLLKLFDLPLEAQRPYWKRNFAPENTHIYRGWFPLSSSKAQNREGFEIGPDILRRLPVDKGDDILYEATPIPDAALLPDGWRQVAAAYYRGAETVGEHILASLSRSLGIDESIFSDAFEDGISTLRLLHYPKRPEGVEFTADVPERFVEHDGKRYEQVARAHVDSGLLTVLATCGVGGLQAEDSSGAWIDVPVIDDGFAINFGGLLECWTGGRIKATRHRVLGLGENRYSVPFFFEPRPSTRISPLPIKDARAFQPFLYGDHLWAVTTKFPENFGLEDLRPPRAAYVNPLDA